jgi:hypothetical protein
VSVGVANPDGTFSYTRLVTASTFHAGDAITYRFAANVNGQPIVFTPGPTQSTFFPATTYGQPPPNDCP